MIEVEEWESSPKRTYSLCLKPVEHTIFVFHTCSWFDLKIFEYFELITRFHIVQRCSRRYVSKRACTPYRSPKTHLNISPGLIVIWYDNRWTLLLNISKFMSIPVDDINAKGYKTTENELFQYHPNTLCIRLTEGACPNERRRQVQRKIERERER